MNKETISQYHESILIAPNFLLESLGYLYSTLLFVSLLACGVDECADCTTDADVVLGDTKEGNENCDGCESGYFISTQAQCYGECILRTYHPDTILIL